MKFDNKIHGHNCPPGYEIPEVGAPFEWSW